MEADKNSWPEVVGKSAEEAKALIEATRPGLKVDILEAGSMMTMDYRLDRVRVIVNQEGKVA